MVTGWYVTYAKRWIDVFLVLMLGVALSWLMLIICFVYLIAWNFPVFFCQERIGLNEQPFQIWKFRTLGIDTDQPISKRRFWFGDLLRATGLDELPQLWLVLTGKMSLVGPRPLPASYLTLYNPEQRLRHQVRPGITGLAQVNGGKSASWKEKFEWDKRYLESCSLRLDLSIIFRTILIVLSFNQDKLEQDQPFTGN